VYTIEFEDGQTLKRLGKVCVVIGILLVLIIAFWMWGMPKYRVYEQTLIGEAELARAAQNRQIATLEAQAKKEALEAAGVRVGKTPSETARLLREIL
jgi:beta-lactam-binding protein with PASTA domain